MKEEILTKDEKKEFEKYINFMLQNGFKKEEFEFTKMPNQNPCILKVRVRDFSKNFNIENGVLEGMVLGQTYMLKDLGLYVNEGILSDKEKESIGISFKNDNGYFSFPVFKKGTMYAGMYPYREYTLEELGL